MMPLEILEQIHLREKGYRHDKLDPWSLEEWSDSCASWSLSLVPGEMQCLESLLVLSWLAGAWGM